MNKDEILSALRVSPEVIAAILKDLVIPPTAKSHNSSLERIAEGLIMVVVRNEGGGVISVSLYFNDLFVPIKSGNSRSVKRGLSGMHISPEDKRRIKTGGWMVLFTCRNREITNSWGSDESINLSDVYEEFPEHAPPEAEEVLA